MAISLVQHAQNNAQNASSQTITSCTVTLSSTTAGNCLVVCMTTDLSDSFVFSTPSVKLGGSAGNFASLVEDTNGFVAIWADPNCAGGQTSLVVSVSGTGVFFLGVDVFEFSGVVTSSPLDKSSSGDGTSGNWSSGATATTTAAVEAWVGTAISEISSATHGTMTGPSSPWTNEAQMNINAINGAAFSDSMISGYQITSSTGAATYNGSESGGTVDGWGAAVVTLKPAIVNITSTGSMTLGGKMTFAATGAGGDTTATGAMTLKESLAAGGVETFASTGAMALNPGFVASGLVAPTFPVHVLGLKIELLLNGTWTDISDYVYERSVIAITRGRPNETQSIQAANMTMVLNNRSGRFTPKKSDGAYYPYITTNTQIRVHILAASVSGFVYNGYRFWGEVSTWPPSWDSTGNDVYVTITAAGIMQRLTQNSRKIGSPTFRYVSRLSGAGIPLAYWPLEDGISATQFASGLAGGTPMTWTGTPSLATSTAFMGSDPLPELNGAVFTGTPGSFSAGSVTYNTPGTYLFLCPGGITSLTSAEAWGSGAGGGQDPGTGVGGNGAGGGEYAKETSVAVTPGNTYTVIVAAGGTEGQDGAASSFQGDSVTVTAHGGKAAGNAGTGSTNTTHHDGGAGAANGGGQGGAGGGSSGGSAAAGNAGSAESGLTGGAGGAAPTGGGAGGAGGTFGGACVDAETEIFTRRGWLRYYELWPGDEIWAIDLENGPRWCAITDVKIHHEAPRMTTVTGPGISARVNSEHRWLVRNGKGWAYKVLAELEPDDFIPFEDRTGVYIRDLTFEEGPGIAPIWCPTTELGNWLARRNDTTYFIGNKPE